jgi:hypothetical protein
MRGEGGEDRHEKCNPIAGALGAVASFAGMLVAIPFARIVAEFILMVFRINEHLAAIRTRGMLGTFR